jgi:tyrosine-protein kinase Etk/Wzc
MQYNDTNEDQEQDFQIKAFLDTYVSHWKWFLLGVCLSFFSAYIYLRYTIPQYQASTTLLVKDEKKGGMLSELSAFADMGIGGGMKSNVDNEIEILKSRTLVESTVKSLRLNIALITEGKIRDAELFDRAPIVVDFLMHTPESFTKRMVFVFSEVSPNTFELENGLGNSDTKSLLAAKKEYRYGEIIRTKEGNLIIDASKFNPNRVKKDTKPITIVISPLEGVTASFKNRLKVTPLSKTSSVVELSIVDPVIRKSEAFLDNLVQIYNQNAVSDKNSISENTSKFIASRLALITEELDGVEQNAESFKRSNNLTDLESEAKLFIEGSSEYNKKVVDIEIQLNVVSSMLDFMRRSSKSDLLPTNIVSGTGDAAGLISSYNQLVLDRNRILKSATLENPTVVKLDQEISSLKANVIASLKRMQSTLSIQKRNLSSQEGLMNSKIEKVPGQERQFRAIARQQKVKEELYLYLLQKREETAISLSATEPNAKVIDAAKASKSPVSPKKNIIYLAALLLGLLIPFGIIYLMDLLDTKIKSRLDLEGKTPIPFIGDVPTSESPQDIIKSESRTSSAEALRIIRTNLDFMLTKVPDGTAQTIFLTSTFPSEGKTFVSVNLAGTFALSGKKVLLVGMDLRNPRLNEYLNLPERGVTNYLSSKDLKLEDLIVKQEGFEDFHVLPAGVIPPNPAELLMGKKTDELFDTLKKQYDYIIVDTAPVSLVTDTLLVAKYADCFIYVVRANFLEKRMLSIANALYREKKLPNMCLLLNDTDSTKGYGYGYGYGVKVAAEPWYTKLWNK